MRKHSFLLLAFLLPALQACSPAPNGAVLPGLDEPTNTPRIVHYTDADIESWLQHYPFLNAAEYGTPSPEDALERLSISLDELNAIDHWVGDCYDRVRYDLSPSYWLFVDRNVCFGLHVWVERKDASG